MSGIELSLNQATTRPYSLEETAEQAAEAGIRWIGLWTDPVAELGIPATRKTLENTGLAVSSLCRVGFVADKRDSALAAALDEARRAIDTAHDLGALQLTFIAGGLPEWDRSIRTAEERVAEALAEIAPYAENAGVRLALEPLHPLFVTGRSVVTTIAQALRVIQDLPVEAVGILVDAYAVFWDPELRTSLHEAAARIAGYQINDFALPLPMPEHMNGRLIPGDGELDLVELTREVLGAGYDGPIEVEVFNDELWSRPLKEIIDRTVAGFASSIGALSTSSIPEDMATALRG